MRARKNLSGFQNLTGLPDILFQKQKISAALLANSWNKNYTWARIESSH